jgi:hypothetical protein
MISLIIERKLVTTQLLCYSKTFCYKKYKKIALPPMAGEEAIYLVHFTAKCLK